MNAEIISVGTELLLGHTINTDAAFVARELSALGINLLFSWPLYKCRSACYPLSGKNAFVHIKLVRRKES